MFTSNRFAMIQRFLSICQKTTQISSISSSIISSSKMKKLIELKQYRKALALFDEQSKMNTDFEINMALKACTKLNDYQRGMKIQQQLSSQSLKNPYIQTSLIHFYSKSFILQSTDQKTSDNHKALGRDVYRVIFLYPALFFRRKRHKKKNVFRLASPGQARQDRFFVFIFALCHI